MVDNSFIITMACLLKNKKLMNIMAANCLINGCLDCEFHRRGVTGMDLHRENDDLAHSTAVVFDTDLPVIMR